MLDSLDKICASNEAGCWFLMVNLSNVFEVRRGEL
jgi:hypothetical protein